MSALDVVRSILSRPTEPVALDTVRIEADLERAREEMARVTPHSHAWYCARDRVRSARRLLVAASNRTGGR